ncbi:class I SAM-dependent methyltransferase [Virgibacillus sp. FSP13]
MEKTNVEKLFDWIDQTSLMIQQNKNEPYLDSLATTLECLFNQNVTDDVDDIVAQKIQHALKNLPFHSFETEEIHKAIQLAILKGMKDSTQQQHLMTPEAVALLIGYLAEKVTKGYEKLRVFDPACGTGSLLTTIVKQLKQPTEAFGSEVDPTLIKLSLLNANLQKTNIEFFHQDSLGPFLLDPVDLVVADLPVGYYPDDIRANDYELKADEGHSYAHHLFIEQSMNYTNDGGYLIFVIPDFLFNSDQADKLHAYLQKNAHIIGVLRLPESAFKSEKSAKNILVLQKKGNQTSSPKQPLLVQLPSLKNAKAMNDILDQMNSWFANYLG